MSHTSKLVEVIHVADEALAVRVRCCDDPTTDSVHTIYGLHNLSEADIDVQITQHKARVETKHEAKQRALQHVVRLMAGQ